MNLTRFLNVVNQYLATAASSDAQTVDEATLIKNLEATLATEVDVQLTSALDATSLDRAAFYYNFMNYPLLVGCIYIVATVMLSFRDEKISRRIAMGGVTPEHVNRILLAANALFALALWLSYVLISFVVVRPLCSLFTVSGLF